MKKLLVSFLLLAVLVQARAGEGMWLPLFLKQLNEAEMKSMGMKMNAEDIYSVNKGSLKDAIVSFGGGCTGEVISDQGLVLTNHHCGVGYIQSHSSVEKNYIDNGFWAKNRAEEIANPGLFVTFIARMEDVTTQALQGITAEMSEKERQSAIDKNLNAIRTGAAKETYQDVMVRPFYKGNQFFLFVTETYRDIRLVGAPPSSIGSFGHDTDNWVWPRHSADFSLFRIYASPDNKPAEYSADNVPFKPRHFLPISMDGVAAGDFTMVFGFPGRTDEYLPAVAVDNMVNVLNPIRIGMRDKSLAVINEAMRNSTEVKIQYTSKQSRIANAWKKWIGESQGVNRTGGIARKQKLEADFQRRVDGNPAWKQSYGTLLADYKKLSDKIMPYAKTRDYVSELGTNIELFQLASTLSRFVTIYENNGAAGFNARKAQITSYLENFYADYRPEIDKKVMAALMEEYFNKVAVDHLDPYAVEQIGFAGKDYDIFAATVFAKSMLDDKDAMLAALADTDAFITKLKADYGYTLCRSIITNNEQKVLPEYNAFRTELDLLERKYMQTQMDVFTEKRFYPDANSTLRVTYGKAEGYEARDAVNYSYMTTLDGVMEKYKPGDYEYDVPQRLRELHAAKDYGIYGVNGEMPVCFIGSNHTTGGNSGSPAVDAWGNLIGLNFDRTWEGTMSDLNYDPTICRNIMVDARYLLFIIDKFAGAGHLVNEMKLVYPKSKPVKKAEEVKKKAGKN
jgi:hypothetical protein